MLFENLGGFILLGSLGLLAIFQSTGRVGF
jgi:hypothetical protein